MSNKRTDRPIAGRSDDDDNEEQLYNKSARLDAQSAAPSTVGSSLAAAASSVSALPPILPSLSSAQRLYSDALISVFGFLDLRGVISAHASCRSWRDAAYKEPSRKITLWCDPLKLAWFCASPLRHHVGEYSSAYLRCTLQRIATLRAFPVLTHVTIRVDPSSVEPLAALESHEGQAGYAEAISATVAEWPSRLVSLSITLSEEEGESRVAEAQVLIDCIGRLDTLTELELRLPELSEDSLALQPLLRLTKLQTLAISGYSPGPANCTVLKQLRSLTHLDLALATESLEAIQTLCAPPHQLGSLQRIDLNGDVTAAHMEALICLPALSALNPGAMDLAATAYLPRFPHLRTLHLSFQEEMKASAFMPHLTQCTQLTALHVGRCEMALAELMQLSRSLTALTSLTFVQTSLRGMRRSSALSCLRSLPQLRELEFGHCSGVRLAHLTDPAFTSLSGLRSLDVRLALLISSRSRAPWKVPCSLMPQLLHCHVSGS